MRAIAALLSVVAVLLVPAALHVPRGLARPAAAPTGIDRDGHPVVGAWRWDHAPDDPGRDLSYGIFHADGTFMEAHPLGGAGIGSWRPTGERSAEVTVYFQDIDTDPSTFTPGMVTVVANVEVDDSGEQFSGKFTAEGATPDGTSVFAIDGVAMGTRLQSGAMTP